MLANATFRVAAWAVINDSFVAGFFNGNPQIFVSEMVGDMSCREALFEAETADDFLRLLSMGPTEPKPPSLATSISSLLMDVWPGPADPTYKRLTPGNLLTIISGMSNTFLYKPARGLITALQLSAPLL